MVGRWPGLGAGPAVGGIIMRAMKRRGRYWEILSAHVSTLALSAAAFALASVGNAEAADMKLKAPPPSVPSAYDWTGFYVGGHLGIAWGNSNWTTAPNLSGALDLFQGIDTFNESGSFLAGVQVGYDYMLPNRIVVGAVANASFPSFPNLSGISIGGISTLASPVNGPETFAENVLHFGTVRARLGYAPGNWLLYATGGFAWSYDQQTLTQLSTGTADMPFLWRLGWAAGAGFEVPVAPHWTGGFEYLFTDFGSKTTTFSALGQQFSSNFSLQEVRASLNYRFDEKEMPAQSRKMLVKARAAATDDDRFNFHAQFTLTEQGYPPFHAPDQGPNSLPGSGQGREVGDTTLFAGVRLWQGAELWINPELDQGFGVANTHGVAGYVSGEAYKF